MFRYGKTAQNAISIMSFLAERFGNKSALSSSLDIASNRKLPRPVVAKLLTQLSQKQLIKGVPGPNGGYTLARPPETISLLSIVSVFENINDRIHCPFGPEWCGNEDPCPIHDQIVLHSENLRHFLQSTHLDVFQQVKPPLS